MSALSFFGASSAGSATAFYANGVFLVVRMPLRTVRFLGVGVRTAVNVFFGSDCLQMIRVHAASHAAQMINLQAFRNCPFVDLIRGPMRRNVVTSHGNDAVPLASCAFPQPTTRVGFWHCIRIKAILNAVRWLASDLSFHEASYAKTKEVF